MDTWRNLCTNACAQYAGPGNCLASRLQRRHPNKTKPQSPIPVRAPVPFSFSFSSSFPVAVTAAYSRQVACGGISRGVCSKPRNQTETKTETETKPKRTCFSIKSVEQCTKIHLNCPQRTAGKDKS